MFQSFRVAIGPLIESRYKSVRDEMGDQPRQSDVFRVIAARWKEMSPEEKAPFVEEAQKDRKRYKSELQQYHKLRRDVERQVSRFGAYSEPSQLRNSKFLQKAFQNRDGFRVAQILLAAGDNNQKETLDMLDMTIKVLVNDGPTVSPFHYSHR